MAGVVLDCSVTLPWYLEDERSEFTDQLFDRIGETPMVVPGLWRLEFVNALHTATRRGRISEAWRDRCISAAAALPMEMDSHPIALEELSELALAHSLTPYDTAYFELARRRRLTLATLDADLVRAAREAKVSLATDLALFPEPSTSKIKSRKR